MENFFKLKENHTDVRTEVIAGITTFMTMAYILAVNPSILSASGMDAEAVLIATCLASAIGTWLMALLANYPFALAPGLGLNAFFTYSVCIGMHCDWRIALMAVFIEGVIFIILSLTNVREAIFNAIPTSLKIGTSAGIGIFCAFIGLQNAHLVVNSDSTLVSYTNFKGTIHQEGIGAILCLFGLILITILYAKKISCAVLAGIIVTWVLGMLCEALGIYVPVPENGFPSLFPSFAFTDFSKIQLTFGQAFAADWSNTNVFGFITIVLSFLFVDIFDTIGSLIGCSEKAGYLDKDGKLPNVRGALLADAVATSVGAIFGTSTTTTFVESVSGVSVGGRTGLTSIVTGILFILSIFFAPIFIAIPGFATAPAMIFVGFLMVSLVLKLDFTDLRSSVPAYISMVFLPLMYSVSEGIAFGVISYVVINTVCNLLTDDKREISPLMYVLTILFVCKYVFL